MDISRDEQRVLHALAQGGRIALLKNAAGKVTGLEFFNRDGWQVGGGSSIVDATSWNAADGYEVTAAPSMRMVVSLADFDDSRWINLTGVSGHPASSHYTDQTELYVAGRTLKWAYSREAVEAATEDRLVLVPGSD